MRITARQLQRRDASVQRALDVTVQELAHLPSAELRALAPVLVEAQREVARELRTWLAGKDMQQRFTAQMRRDVFVQISGALDKVAELDPALYAALRRGRITARDLAAKHVRRQLAVFSAKFEGTIGSIPIVIAARLAEGKLLLRRYKSSARRYAGLVRDDIKREIAIGVTRKETLFQMTNRLVRMGGPRGFVDLIGGRREFIAEGLFKRYDYWAARFVRTEMIEQYNQQAVESVEQVRRVDPEIVMRWDSSLDGRTCAICESLHGLERKPGENFPDGIDHPPAHPNCRCALVAWRADWERAT